MSGRFKRPVSADQINQTLEMLQRGAQKHSADPDVSDLLYKAGHVIRLLWRECSLHETWRKSPRRH